MIGTAVKVLTSLDQWPTGFGDSRGDPYREEGACRAARRLSHLCRRGRGWYAPR